MRKLKLNPNLEIRLKGDCYWVYVRGNLFMQQVIVAPDKGGCSPKTYTLCLVLHSLERFGLVPRFHD